MELGTYQPAAGNAFEIIDADMGITGKFAEAFLPELDSGLLWTIDYSLNAVTLNIRESTIAADFDLDTDVDEDDFVAWQGGFGRFADGGALAADGDSNGDGNVDGDDFLTWQRQFGSGVASRTGSLSVPEPTTIGLLLGLAVGAIFTRCRQVN